MKSAPATAAVPSPFFTAFPPVSGLLTVGCTYGPYVCGGLPYVLCCTIGDQLVTRSGSALPCCMRYSWIWLRSDCTIDCEALVRAWPLALLNCGMTIAARIPSRITTTKI